MERADTDLCDLFIRQGSAAFTENRVRQLMHQFFLGMHTCHTFKIVHLDLKPDNILVMSTPEGREHVKVTDFGMSRIFSPETTGRSRVGTPDYADPEIMRGGSPTLASDVWSAGVVLYTIITGRFLLGDEEKRRGVTEQEFATRIVPMMNRRLAEANASREVSNLIYSMLRVNPLRRITFGQALEHPWFKLTGGPDRPLNLQVFAAFNAQRRLKLSENWVWLVLLREMQNEPNESEDALAVLSQYVQADDVHMSSADLQSMAAERGLGPVFHLLLMRDKPQYVLDSARLLLNLTAPTVEQHVRRRRLAHIAHRRLHMVLQALQDADPAVEPLLLELLVRISKEEILLQYMWRNRHLLQYLRSIARRVNDALRVLVLVYTAIIGSAMTAGEASNFIMSLGQDRDMLDMLWLHCLAKEVEPYTELLTLFSRMCTVRELGAAVVSASLPYLLDPRRVRAVFLLAELCIVNESTRRLVHSMQVVRHILKGLPSVSDHTLLLALVHLLALFVDCDGVMDAIVEVADRSAGPQFKFAVDWAMASHANAIAVSRGDTDLQGTGMIPSRAWYSSPRMKLLAGRGTFMLRNDAVSVQRSAYSHSLPRGSGRWYYEVEMVSPISDFGIGWAVDPVAFAEARGHAGESEESVGVLRDRRVYRHLQKRESTVNMPLCTQGAVIGCGVDCDQGLMYVWYGRQLVTPNGVPVTSPDAPQWSSYSPAISLGFGQQVRVRFGHDVSTLPPTFRAVPHDVGANS
jgi:hypothetical protein